MLSGLATFGDILLPDKTGIDISHDDLLRHLQNASGCAAQVTVSHYFPLQIESVISLQDTLSSYFYWSHTC